jgi:hypothetical protein
VVSAHSIPCSNHKYSMIWKWNHKHSLQCTVQPLWLWQLTESSSTNDLPDLKKKLFICQKHFLATSPQWMQAKNAPPKAITSFGTSHKGTHTKSKAVFVYRVASSASVTSDRGSSLSSSESEDQSIPRSNDAKGSCMLVWLKWVSLGHYKFALWQ